LTTFAEAADKNGDGYLASDELDTMYTKAIAADAKTVTAAEKRQKELQEKFDHLIHSGEDKRISLPGGGGRDSGGEDGKHGGGDSSGKSTSTSLATHGAQLLAPPNQRDVFT
jgi:hypothetical protein